MALSVTAFDHIVLNVVDPEASAAWYQRVLGVEREDFAPTPGGPTRISIRFGAQKINLRPVLASAETWFTAKAPTAGSDDLCFLTTAEPEAVVAHLTILGVAIAAGPSLKHGARGTLRSVYCRDPDGNLIEIASYG